MFPLEANGGLTGKDRRSGSCVTPVDIAAILSPGMIDAGKSYLNVLFPAFVGGVEDPMTAVCLAPDLPCAASSLAAVCPPVGFDREQRLDHPVWNHPVKHGTNVQPGG